MMAALSLLVIGVLMSMTRADQRSRALYRVKIGLSRIVRRVKIATLGRVSGQSADLSKMRSSMTRQFNGPWQSIANGTGTKIADMSKTISTQLSALVAKPHNPGSMEQVADADRDSLAPFSTRPAVRAGPLLPFALALTDTARR